jgi:hypothetical protein
VPVARERRRVEAWLERVEPGETGSVPPEEGYELEVCSTRGVTTAPPSRRSTGAPGPSSRSGEAERLARAEQEDALREQLDLLDLLDEA